MSLSTNLSPDKQRDMLRQMLTIRRFEERASADYLAGKIYGVVHCYIGEEAIPYSPILGSHVFPDRNRIIAGIREVLTK